MLRLTDIMASPNGVPIYNASPWWPSYPVANAVTPMALNPYSVLSIPAYWRAMNFLATNLASFGRSVHKDGARRADGDPPHPLDRLLRRAPNACQNATIFWRTLFFHAAHTANGYAEIVRDGGGAPVALRNLTDVSPFRYEFTDDERTALERRGLRLGPGAQQFYLVRSPERVLLGADVIHLQALGFDGMSGMDPVGLHGETFQRASTIDRYQTKYLQKGTVIRGAIQIPQGVSDEQSQQIVDTIRQFYRGPDAERDILVLSDGATLNNATLTPQQSQLVEQGAVTTKQIAQLTGVPPQFLYEFSESKYNNSIEQMGQDVVRYTFRPWIEQTEDELTTKLLSAAEQDAGYTVKINPDALLRGDTKAVNESATTTVNAGLRTRNEGRALLGLPRDDDPESDRLKTLGDTSGTASATSAAPARTPRAVADDGAPAEQQSAAPASRLSGYHVSAALKVISRLKAGKIGKIEATELLAAVGIARDRAEAMVAEVSTPASAKAYAAVAPVLAAACDRVDRRTDKAFADNAGRTDAGRTPYFNAFAESQGQFVAESLAPVVETLKSLGAAELPNVERVAERYAAGVRKRAATGEVVRLRELVGG